MQFLCGGGCLTGVIFVLPSMAFVLFNVAKMRQLGRDGVVLSGRVVRSTRAGQPGEPGQRIVRLLIATVLPDDGREVRFEVSGMIPAWTEGTRVPVLIDPVKARTPAVIAPGVGIVVGRRR